MKIIEIHKEVLQTISSKNKKWMNGWTVICTYVIQSKMFWTVIPLHSETKNETVDRMFTVFVEW